MSLNTLAHRDPVPAFFLYQGSLSAPDGKCWKEVTLLQELPCCFLVRPALPMSALNTYSPSWSSFQRRGVTPVHTASTSVRQ